MDHRDDFYLPEETVEWIGLKKSEYLSVLVEKMSENDFGFEDFHRFDHLIPGTIEAPDRSYEDTIDSYLVRTYVRTYREESTFHQVIIGALINDQTGTTVFVPIISFVSKNDELVKTFSVGQPVGRPTLN